MDTLVLIKAIKVAALVWWISENTEEFYRFEASILIARSSILNDEQVYGCELNFIMYN